jgi:hypothetical protein
MIFILPLTVFSNRAQIMFYMVCSPGSLRTHMWMEEREADVLWKEKTSYNRYTHGAYTDFNCIYALKSHTFVQSIYQYKISQIV